MAIPLIVPLGLAAVAAYAFLSKSGGGAAPAPSGGGGGYPPSYPSAPSTPSSPGGGGGSASPSSPGNAIPGSYWDPTNAVPTFPDPGPGPTDQPLGPAADSSGANADPGILGDIGNWFSSSGPADLFWSEHPSVLAVTAGRGGWVPYYPGMEQGYAPPEGWPIH